jgi:hypothetical protein
LSITRCYKCSKYNHRAQEYFWDVECPHCTQSHTMHKCKASKENHRCVNCINYSKYNKTMQINVNRSSPDKSCSCYIAVLKKYIERMDYQMDSRTNRTNREMKPLCCLQVNLKHKCAATYNLVQMMSDNQTDLAFVQEPYIIRNDLARIPKSLRTNEWK